MFHVYARRGVVDARVDTSYEGRWRVDTGAWRDLDGTHMVPGESVQLEVLEAAPELVLIGG